MSNPIKPAYLISNPSGESGAGKPFWGIGKHLRLYYRLQRCYRRSRQIPVRLGEPTGAIHAYHSGSTVWLQNPVGVRHPVRRREKGKTCWDFEDRVRRLFHPGRRL